MSLELSSYLSEVLQHELVGQQLDCFLKYTCQDLNKREAIAIPMNIGRYSVKKLSCDAPILNHVNTPTMMGSPQKITTHKNASREDNIPTDVVTIILFFIIIRTFIIRQYLIY